MRRCAQGYSDFTVGDGWGIDGIGTYFGDGKSMPQEPAYAAWAIWTAWLRSNYEDPQEG